MNRLLFFAFLILKFTHADGQTLGAQLVKSGFTNPVDITNCNDGSDRLFVVEKAGRIKIIYKNRALAPTIFLDIISKVNSIASERGLLGLAFHPDFSTNGFFYVNYINGSNTRISRFKVSALDPNIADATSEKVMMTINQPYDNHNGGCLKFSPIDGYLYIGMGDGGSGGDPQCYAQNPNSYLGKMLRLDVDQNVNISPYYAVPASNPFYVGNSANKSEIWALGLRNPWRFSFDRKTGDLWIADVGQGAREEINFTSSDDVGGLNYGWKVMEGNSNHSNGNDCDTQPPPFNSPLYTDPIFEYGRSNSTGGYSVSGGFVYRGCDFVNLKGKYICADYGTDNAWTISGGLGTLDTFLKSSVTDITAFGEDEAGELYCVSLGSDSVFRIIDTSVTLKKTLTGSITANEYAVDSLIVNGPVTFTGDTLKLTSKNVLFNGSQEVGANKSLKFIYTGGCD